MDGPLDINDLAALCAAARGALPHMPTDQMVATAAAIGRVEGVCIANTKAQRGAAAAPKPVEAAAVAAEIVKG